MFLTAAVLQVVLWHSYREGEERALAKAVAQYNELAKAREVEVVAVPVPFAAYAEKRAAAIPHGNGPDLFISSHEGRGEWRRDGLVAPLAGPIDETRFLGSTAAPFVADGKAYGVPLAWKSVALYYRTDRFSTPPKSTNEIFAVVSGHGYAITYETGAYYFHAVWLHAFGGMIMAPGASRPVLDTPAGEAALAWVEAEIAQGRIPGDASSTTAVQLFRDGKAATLVSGPWLLTELPESVPYAVAPLPWVDEAGARARALLTIDGAFVSAQAHAPEEAERFARWLAEDGALVRAREGRQLVSAKSAWNDPIVAGDKMLSAFRAQLDASVVMSTNPAMATTWEPAQEALRKALRGELSPHDALAGADKRIARALAPAPPASDPRPYLVAVALLAAGAFFWLRRRSRLIAAEPVDRGIAPLFYLSPAVICLVLLVFVPFAVGATMSLFHHLPGPHGGRFVFVGLRNFVRLLGSTEQPLTDPLSFYFTLVVTLAWMIVNVTLHVIIGVTLALLLRDPLLRMRGIYRVLLIVPWAMPSYITALVWKGMFHRQLGAINALLAHLGVAPIAWFSHFWTSFVANVATNVWLGFPFMMVVTLGALARIPRELEEAAALDGASAWQRLRYVILPLLRPALMPSIILGAVWTFNMFNVVFLVSGGEPDGATEILISQAYRWAFGPGRGQQYGYAAAYAVVIFILLWAQTRLTRRVTEVDA